jgi:tetratricopeptide (TPR) repeat protein
LGADQQKSVGAFIEGYFRFPESQGSEVARIRMLSQGLKGMKDREKKRAIDEIDAIAEKSQLPQIQEFVTLMKSDGLSRRGEFKNSLDLLVGYFQDHPTTANLPVFRGRILRNISDVLKEEVENKNFINALSFYGKYSTTWLKNSNRIDTRYYQAVAFEHAGVLSEAQKSLLNIREDLKKIVGTKEEKERNVYEHLPTVSQVELRLAAIANEERRYRDAFNHLSAIKSLKTTSEEIERVQIGATVAENMGDIKQAIQHLQKLLADYSAQPELVVKAELHLARLYMRENNLTDVNKHLVKLEEAKAKSSQALSDDDWLKTLELRAEWLLQNNQKLAAVDTYTKLLEQFEGQYPLASVRYNAGKILFDEGDLRGAEKIWSQFDDKSGAFYARLAREKLQQAEWQDSYKKYIDRIPAATGLK